LLKAQDKSLANPDTSKVIHSLNIKTYTFLLFNDFKKQAIAPFKISSKQAVHLGEFSIITAGLIIEDGNIDDVAKKQKSESSFINSFSPKITNFGSSWGIYSVGAFELYGLIFKDKRAQVTGLLASQALITSGVWTRIGKFVAGRERPSASYEGSRQPGGEWHWLSGCIDYYEDNKKFPGSSYDAFPSGHTSTAFSMATVFAKMYPDKAAVPIIAYSVATLVGLSRLTEHAHWMSDVFVGAALGYLCGSQVVNNYRKYFKLHAPMRKHKDVKLSLNYYDKNFLAGVIYNI
jgi:hypothetical protein